MKKINIYSPVSGYIDLIENISDEVFSNKLLGEDFVIKPSQNDFCSFFDSGNIEMIFDTKHAIAIKDNDSGCVGLMHIGLETVALNGQFFDLKVKVSDNIKLNDKVVSADLAEIERKNINTETAIVFDVNQFEFFNFELLKKGEVKQGELVGEITFDKLKKTDQELIDLIKNENHFYKSAKLIYDNVGNKENITDFYNCMTRLRIVVKDPKKITIDKIKKIDIVKGVNWNGNEFQIIVGGTVVKLKEEFQKIYDDTNKSIVKENKLIWYKKIMPTISGIMMPTIPVLMTVGLIGALYNILTLTGAISELPESGNVLELDVFSGLLYILSKVGLNLIGVVFIYTTVRFLKGNTVMAIFIGFSLISPLFIFGDQNGWELFKIGNTSISVKNYVDSMLPFIIAGFLYFYFDKWVKTWMPASVDVVFRHVLTYLFTIFCTLFILGPIFGILEELMAITFVAFEKLPIGIGVAVFAFLWQILVLTGSHVAVVVAMQPAAQTLGYSVIYLGILFAPLGQVAASIGVAVKTKNSKLKQVVYASLPAGVFGITEPIIYGVTLPRLKPFFFGCIAAALGVLVTVNTGAHVGINGYFSMGIVTLLSVGPTPIYIAWTVIGLSITFAIAFVLTYFFDSDRIAELKGVKNTIRAISKSYAKLSNISIKQANHELIDKFASELENLREHQKDFKSYEIEFVKLQTISNKYDDLILKEEKIKNKLYKNAIKSKGKENYDDLVLKYNNFNLDIKKQPILMKREELFSKIDSQKTILEKIKENIQENINNKVDQLIVKTNCNQLSEYKKEFFNAVNSLEIFFGNIEKKNFNFNKKLFSVEISRRGKINA